MTHTESTATVTHEGRQSFVTITVGGEIVSDMRLGSSSHLSAAVKAADYQLVTSCTERLEDIAEGATFAVTAGPSFWS
jgi:hypothetical protein